MSYEQAMRHSKSHRKDKYYQPCSAYSENLHLHSYNAEPDKFDAYSKTSIQKIINSVVEFPIYIAQDCHIGIWELVPSNHLFASKIKNHEELLQFALDCA